MKDEEAVTGGVAPPVRHLLSLRDLSAEEMGAVLRLARRGKKRGGADKPLEGKVLAMLFQKESTRTRLSFECAILQLGGHSVFMGAKDTQLARDESVADTARVFSRMVDVVAVRAVSHQSVVEMAKHSDVPVINALTDLHHPCQLLADMLTFQEKRGPITGRAVAWFGDVNNMCRSYAQAAVLLDFQLRIATPSQCVPPSGEIQTDFPPSHVSFFTEPKEAAKGADLLVTDVWTSMGQEDSPKRRALFEPYQVDKALMMAAAEGALFTHCLPAHRGEEVTAEVLDGPHSMAWDAAGNRLHAQKALLLCLLGDGFSAGSSRVDPAEDEADPGAGVAQSGTRMKMASH